MSGGLFGMTHGSRLHPRTMQVVERVNKLVFVRPLKTRYDPAQGDVVVARVTEV